MKSILYIALLGLSFSASAQQLDCIAWDEFTADQIIEVFNTTTNPYMECVVTDVLVNVDPSQYEGNPTPKLMGALQIGDRLGPRAVFRDLDGLGTNNQDNALTAAKDGITVAQLQVCHAEAYEMAQQITLCGGTPNPDPDPPLTCPGGADPVCPTPPVVCPAEAAFACEVQLLRDNQVISTGRIDPP